MRTALAESNADKRRVSAFSESLGAQGIQSAATSPGGAAAALSPADAPVTARLKLSERLKKIWKVTP
jgi:hypothetical protein